jgi:uncharacterized protein (TIGR02246 family)
MRTLSSMLIVLLSAASAGAVEPVVKVDVNPDTAAMYVADRAWSHAVAEKDPLEAVESLTDDAIVLPPGGDMVSGKDAIRSFYKRAFEDKAFAVNREPESVALVGDMAYTVGKYRAERTGPDGKKVSENGKYVLVWKKQPDKTWKVAVDIWNTSKQ